MNGITQCSGDDSSPSNVAIITYVDKRNHPRYVIPTAASAEWRNPLRWTMNQHKVKLAAWEDSSTRFRSLGMTCRGMVPFNHTGCIRNVAGGRLPIELRCDCPRQSINSDSLREAPPLRQCTTFLAFYRTQIGNSNVKNVELRNKCIVGAAICRPPRIEYNLFG